MYRYILMTNLNQPRNPRWSETFTKADDSIEDCVCSLEYIISLVQKELKKEDFLYDLLVDITIDVNEKEIFFSVPNPNYQNELEIYNEKYKKYLSELEKYNEWEKTEGKKIKLEKLKETKAKNEKDLLHYENNCNAYKILLEKNQKEIEELEKEINNAN